MNTIFITILLLILLVLVFLAYKQEQRDKAYFENSYLKEDFSEEVSLTHVQEEKPITGEEIVAIAEEIVNPTVETPVETPVEAPKKKKSRPRKKSAPKKKED
jgi:regulatory protein YycI of two-component signal transduction system YycFG